jgi:hypothetical protein
MNNEPTFAEYRQYQAAVAAMMADHDCTGDLLLVGLWLARARFLRVPEPGEGRWGLAAIARDLYGPGKPYTITALGVTERIASTHIRKVQRVFTDDVPRYDPLKDSEGLWHPFGGYDCASPMIRRDGLCGQPATKEYRLTDVSTGRIHVLAACRRHHGWLDAQYRQNRAEVKEIGEHLPVPAMNAGGVLARHVPGLNWRQMWTALRPGWTQPAEGTPTGKPKLEVLSFEPEDQDDLDEAVELARPTLSVIQGGWTSASR